jgi:DNA-binding CsgD family transcriptional regulator/tetratricopeptide (TPR) repeat protein
MLKTIREYALERLVEAGEWESARRAHALYALALAEEAESTLTQISSPGWLKRLDEAHADIRAAIIWSCSEEVGSLTALRLTSAIWRFWMFRGYAKELRVWIERALENSARVAGGAAPAFALVRARALAGAGVLVYHEGNYAAAREELEASAAIFREHNDRWGLAFCTMYQGLLAGRRSGADDVSLFREAVALFRQTGDRWGLAQALNPLGTSSLRRGDFAAAREALDECLRLFRELGDDWGVALACRNMGRFHYRKGEYDQAAVLLKESLGLLGQVGERTTLSGVLNMLGEVELAQGDWAAAAGHFAESLALSREVGVWENVALALSNLGALAYFHHDLEQAKTHFQESLLVYQKFGRDEGVAADLLCLAAVAHANAREAEAALLEVRARRIIERLGNSLAYGEQIRSGYALHAARCIFAGAPTAPWIRAALNLSEILAEGSTPEGVLALLTKRELDVLRLVAQGRTNNETARELHITVHTVTRHLTHIYTKVGITNRTEAVAFAIRNGLEPAPPAALQQAGTFTRGASAWTVRAQ